MKRYSRKKKQSRKLLTKDVPARRNAQHKIKSRKLQPLKRKFSVKRKQTRQKQKTVWHVTSTSETHQGRRQYQEDRLFIIEDSFKNHPHIKLYLVCDGHGSPGTGHVCSDFVSKKYVEEFINEINKKKSKNPNIKTIMQKSLCATIHAWDKHVFGDRKRQELDDKEKVDDYFKNIDYKNYIAKGLDSGTTLVAVVVDTLKKQIHTLHIGDSRFVSCVNGKIISTFDHGVPKHNRQVGKFIVRNIDDRVEGDLSMSRSIGDFSIELLGRIIHDGDYNIYKNLDQKNFQFVVASDGLFEQVDNHSLFLNPFKTSQELVNLIGEHNFDDNTSFIIVDVNEVNKE